MLYFSEPNSAKTFSVEEVHRLGPDANAKLVRFLKNAPRQFIQEYCDLCVENYSEAGLLNLHTLILCKNFSWSSLVLKAIRSLAASASLPFLLKALEKADSERRTEILKALTAFPGSQHAESVLACLNDSNATTVLSALQLLHHWQVRVNTAFYHSILSYDHDQLRSLAFDRLLELGTQEQIDDLIKNAVHTKDSKKLSALLNKLPKLNAQQRRLLISSAYQYPSAVLLPWLKDAAQNGGLSLWEILYLAENLTPQLSNCLLPALKLVPSTPDDVKTLIESLHSIKNQDWAKQIAKILAIQHEAAAKPVLVQLVLQRPDIALEPFLELFTKEPESDERSSIIMKLLRSEYPICQWAGLHLIRDPQSYEHIIRKLATASDTKVHTEANRLLQLMDSRSLQSLRAEIDQLLNLGQAYKAACLIKSRIPALDNDPEWDWKYCLCLFEAKDLDQLIDRLHSRVAKWPEDKETLRLLAQALYNKGNAASALVVLQRTQSLQPNDFQIKKLICQCHLDLKDYIRALQLSFDLPLEAFDPSLLEQLLTACLAHNRLSSVITLATSHKQIMTVKCRLLLAKALYLNGQMDDYLQCQAELLNNFEANVENLDTLLDLAEATQSLELMELYLQEMVRLNPESCLYLEKFLMHILKTRPDEVIHKVSESETRTPLLKVKGIALGKLGRGLEALDLLESLFIKDPGDTELPYFIAETAIQEQAFAKALKYLAYYDGRHQAPNGTSLLRAKAHYQQRELTKTQTWLLLALNEEPSPKEAWRLLCTLAVRELLNEPLKRCLPDLKANLIQDLPGLLEYSQYVKRISTDEYFSLHQEILHRFPNCQESRLILAAHHHETGNYLAVYEVLQPAMEQLDTEWQILFVEAALACMKTCSGFKVSASLYREAANRHRLSGMIAGFVRTSGHFARLYELLSPKLLSEESAILKDFPILAYKLGAKSYADNRLEEARHYFELVDSAAPANFRTNFYLGLCSLAMGQTVKAITHFEKALLDNDRKPIQIRTMLGEMYFEQRQLEKSLIQWKVVLEGSRYSQNTALEYLQKIFVEQNRPDEFLTLALPFAKQSQASLSKLLVATMANRANKPEVSLEYVSQIQPNSPYYQDALFEKSRALLALNRNHEAYSALEPMADKRPLPMNYYLVLGEASFRTGRMFSARQQLETHADLYPNQPKCIRLLYEVAKSQGDIPGLIRYSLHCLELGLLTSSECYQTSQTIAGAGHEREARLILWEGKGEAIRAGHRDSIIACLQLVTESQEHQSFWQELYAQKPDLAKEIFSGLKLPVSVLKQMVSLANNIHPMDWFWNLQGASLAFFQNDEELALQYYQNSRDRLIDNKDQATVCEFYLQWANLFQKNKQTNRATELLRLALKANPAHKTALLRLSYNLGQLDLTQERFKVDQQLFFADPQNLAVSKRLSLEYLRRNDWQNAIIHLKKLARQSPKDTTVLKQLADAAKHASLYTIEIHALERLLRLAGEGKEARTWLLRLGNAWLGSGKELKAAETFQTYLHNHPDNPALKLQLAQIYKRHGHLDKAVSFVKELLKQDLVNPTLNFELAELYFLRSDLLNSIPLLQKTLELKPFHSGARLLLAQSFIQRGNHKEALRELDSAHKHEPNNLSVRELKAKAYKNLGMFAEARKELQEIYGRNQSYDILLEIAVLNMKERKTDMAMQQLHKIVSECGEKSRQGTSAADLLKKLRATSA